MSDWLSLRFRDARLGAIGLLVIVFGVMLFPLASSFGEMTPPFRRVLSLFFIIVLLFPPAILSAVYSLFFEKSKFYGGLNVLLVSIIVLLQPLAWRWLRFYLPIACIFTILCAVIWGLGRASTVDGKSSR